MLAKYNLPLEQETISNSVTLVPRLEYSLNLLNDIIEILEEKRNELNESNRHLVLDFDESDKTHLEAIRLEQTISHSLDIVLHVKHRTGRIFGIASVPEVLPASIPMIRTVSAQLFDIIPLCSQKMSELSVHLGSIILDSAVLTKARFDFSQSNKESTMILDEVKLMADSKLSKQYPNLDFSKL
ncbi:MAG: hypothetical protein OEY17_01580 [Nitrosopumilus sp.]|nr:hypothetical protein [Nitrosopumilus sp.]MDH5658025.1 hypothetical protein [Nitrosopumilus sp.]